MSGSYYARQYSLELRHRDPVTEVADLFQANYRMLLGYANYLGADEDAEDIVAEAFYELYKRWHGLRDHDAALAYLRSVVSYQVRMRIRHLQVVRRHPPGKVPDAASAESEVVAKEDHREVVAALRQLSDRQREVLVHRYWLGRTEAEVAAALSISEGSVKAHVSRAMSSLTKALVALR